MKTLKEFITVTQFLGSEMTEDQASRLLDEAREELSASEMNKLGCYAAMENAPLYGLIREQQAEMGVF